MTPRVATLPHYSLNYKESLTKTRLKDVACPLETDEISTICPPAPQRGCESTWDSPKQTWQQIKDQHSQDVCAKLFLKGQPVHCSRLQQTAGTTGFDCFVLIYWLISVLFETNPLFENKYFKKFGWGWKLGCSSIPVKLWVDSGIRAKTGC